MEGGKDKRFRSTSAGFLGLISQDFENLFAALLLLEESVIDLIVLGFANQDMPGGGDQAMVYSARSAQGFLVSAGMKEGQILSLPCFGHPGRGVVGLCFVIIQAIAGYAPYIDPFVFRIPVV